MRCHECPTGTSHHFPVREIPPGPLPALQAGSAGSSFCASRMEGTMAHRMHTLLSADQGQVSASRQVQPVKPHHHHCLPSPPPGQPLCSQPLQKTALGPSADSTCLPQSCLSSQEHPWRTARATRAAKSDPQPGQSLPRAQLDSPAALASLQATQAAWHRDPGRLHSRAAWRGTGSELNNALATFLVGDMMSGP